MQRAAEAVRARMLVVYSPDDIIVSAAPAAEFARLAGADTLVVPSACGHSVFWCEDQRVGAAVRAFIDRGASAAAAAQGGRR
jgi:homoserine acetyltransferase